MIDFSGNQLLYFENKKNGYDFDWTCTGLSTNILNRMCSVINTIDFYFMPCVKRVCKHNLFSVTLFSSSVCYDGNTILKNDTSIR